MGRGVEKLFALVVRLRDDASPKGNDHRADRDFALLVRGGGLVQSHFHVMDVERVTRVGQL